MPDPVLEPALDPVLDHERAHLAAVRAEALAAPTGDGGRTP